jgi:hypothetical protein
MASIASTSQKLARGEDEAEDLRMTIPQEIGDGWIRLGVYEKWFGIFKDTATKPDWHLVW